VGVIQSTFLGPLGFNSPNIAQRHALHVERTAVKAFLLSDPKHRTTRTWTSSPNRAMRSYTSSSDTTSEPPSGMRSGV